MVKADTTQTIRHNHVDTSALIRQPDFRLISPNPIKRLKDKRFNSMCCVVNENKEPMSAKAPLSTKIVATIFSEIGIALVLFMTSIP